MEISQVKSKLDELVGALKNYSFVDNVTYEFATDYDVDLKVIFKPNKDRYNLDEIQCKIQDCEHYLRNNYDEDFEIDWIV